MATVVMAVLISLILNVALLYCYSVKLVEILDELFDKYSDIEDLKFTAHLDEFHEDTSLEEIRKRERVELQKMTYNLEGEERSQSK